MFKRIRCNICDTRKEFGTGFTFIELIIGITIFIIIIVTVYGTFYMGMKVWRRGQGDESIQKVRLGFLRIEKELKNSFSFSGIPFRGTYEEMEFPISISDMDTEDIYRVRYIVDTDKNSGRKELIRKEKVFSKGVNTTEQKIKEILPPMKSIRFEYASRSNALLKNFEWWDIWKGEEQKKLPLGVRITLETPKGEIYNKVIFLPDRGLE